MSVIGIDLGTTNSCVAVFENGSSKIVKNRGGYETTPSMVAISESGRRLIGHIAKRQLITNARHTIYGAKRLIGRKWEDPVTVSAKNDIPYQLIEGTSGGLRVLLRDQIFSLPEISAMILAEMRQVAETYSKAELCKAVVTIPAYFNDAQRQATLDAGKIAGLDILRLINEPTAAAIAYGYRKKLNQRIAVFDLGGGTFDISILDIADGVFHVVATGGDTYLGGEDFDLHILNWLVSEFNKEYDVDLRKDPMSLQRLRDAAETAKIELSNLNTVEINLPFIYSTGEHDAVHLQKTLNRNDYENLCLPLIDRTIELCKSVLSDAELSVNDIDEIVLVGGQTRMPRIQKAVATFFGKEPNKGVHPDQAVALGAVLHANALMNPNLGEDEGLLLLDVTPHNLGIMIAGGFFQILVPANTTVPTKVQHTFTTVRDDQIAVKIVVLQGNEKSAQDNDLLGEFVLFGLRKAKKGEVEVEVHFDISSDGIVSVSARDIETGLEQQIQVSSKHALTHEELTKAISNKEKYAVTEKNIEKFEKIKREIVSHLAEISDLYPRAEEVLKASKFGDDALRKVDDLKIKFAKIVKDGDLLALSNLKTNVERSLQMFQALALRKS